MLPGGSREFLMQKMEAMAIWRVAVATPRGAFAALPSDADAAARGRRLSDGEMRWVLQKSTETTSWHSGWLWTPVRALQRDCASRLF
jgi:hypothetical protein